MRDYLVTWKVYIPANNPKEAARKALRLQRLPMNDSNFFMVKDEETGKITDVDLEA